MKKKQDKDTRYFIEVDIKSRRVIRCGYDQKQNLNKGRQDNPKIHRVFVTPGQYNKFIERVSL